MINSGKPKDFRNSAWTFRQKKIKCSQYTRKIQYPYAVFFYAHLHKLYCLTRWIIAPTQERIDWIMCQSVDNIA